MRCRRLALRNHSQALVLSCGIAFAGPAAAATWYVQAGAAGNGSSAAPFGAVQQAADVVNAGDTVIVKDGLYTCAAGPAFDPNTGANVRYMVKLNRKGTSSAWITFRAENKWGAKWDGQNNRCFGAFRFGDSGDNGSFVRVEGFEIYGFHSGLNLYSRSGGTAMYAHDIVIKDNHIHHLGRVCTTTSYGSGVAIGGSNFYNVTIENNLIHDNGRKRPEEGCAAGTTAHYNNHDHGIYISSYDNVVIKNNIFYNHRAGWAIHLYSSGGKNLKVLNNTFAFKNPGNEGHIIVAQPETNLLLANNLFYEPGASAVIFYNAAATNVQLKNNATSASSIMSPASYPGVTGSGNITSADLKLANPAAIDFRPLATSPAIDKGMDLALHGVRTDYTGTTSRPQGPSYDIGAFEFVSGTPVASAAPARPRRLKWR